MRGRRCVQSLRLCEEAQKLCPTLVSGMGRPNESRGLVEAVLVSINGYRMVNCDDPVTRMPGKFGEQRP